MSLLDAFRLRPVIGIHRELRRLNDTLGAVLLHFSIPTKRDALAARAAAQREADRIDHDPHILDTPTPAQLAADDLRERVKRGEEVTVEELLDVVALEDSEQEPDYRW